MTWRSTSSRSRTASTTRWCTAAATSGPSCCSADLGVTPVAPRVGVPYIASRTGGGLLEHSLQTLKKNSVVVFLAMSFVSLGASAQAPASLSADDRAAIQALTATYLQALSGCRAEEFADLFVPDTGYFASGFRGHFVGRKQLVLLVQSERQ